MLTMMPMMVAFAFVQSGLPLTTLSRAAMSGIDEPRQVVVRTQAEWEALWRAHAADEPRPAVNFSTTMVVGVVLGSRPTAGFDVEIVRATRERDTIVVSYVERKPARDAIVAQVLTSPAHLVGLARHDGPVRFERVDAPKP